MFRPTLLSLIALTSTIALADAPAKHADFSGRYVATKCSDKSVNGRKFKITQTDDSLWIEVRKRATHIESYSIGQFEERKVTSENREKTSHKTAEFDSSGRKLTLRTEFHSTTVRSDGSASDLEAARVDELSGTSEYQLEKVSSSKIRVTARKIRIRDSEKTDETIHCLLRKTK